VRLSAASVPQAGAAVGLAVIAQSRLPGVPVATIVLASAVVLELSGAAVVARLFADDAWARAPRPETA